MMTAKNSKKDMFAEVERVLKSSPVLDKNWVDRAKYALKAGLEKCTKTDLLGLLKEAADFIGTPEPAPVENSPKPALKKGSKKTAKAEKEPEEVAEEVEETTEEIAEVEEKPKKKSGKSLKAPKAKAEGASTLSKKSFESAKIFPKTIEVKDLGTLEIRNNEFKTMDELTNALNEGREIYFAGYWTPRMIREFRYEQSHGVKCPKQFDNDLDIMMAVVTCTNVERVWCMSAYTEAMFGFDGEDLEQVPEKDTEGNEYHIRVCNGLEYEIYEKIAE